MLRVEIERQLRHIGRDRIYNEDYTARFIIRFAYGNYKILDMESLNTNGGWYSIIKLCWTSADGYYLHLDTIPKERCSRIDSFRYTADGQLHSVGHFYLGRNNRDDVMLMSQRCHWRTDELPVEIDFVSTIVQLLEQTKNMEFRRPALVKANTLRRLLPKPRK